MDKMMKLWKELMRCFKGISPNQGQEKAVQVGILLSPNIICFYKC